MEESESCESLQVTSADFIGYNSSNVPNKVAHESDSNNLKLNESKEKYVYSRVESTVPTVTSPHIQEDIAISTEKVKNIVHHVNSETNNHDIALSDELSIEYCNGAVLNNKSKDNKSDNNDLVIQKSKRKHAAVIYSDSEEELMLSPVEYDSENIPIQSPVTENIVSNIWASKKQSNETECDSENIKVEVRKKQLMVDSDSEEESSSLADSFSPTILEQEKNHTSVPTSDDVTGNGGSNKWLLNNQSNDIESSSKNLGMKSKRKRKHITVVNSDSEEELDSSSLVTDISATIDNEQKQNTHIRSNSEDNQTSTPNKYIENYSTRRKQHKQIIESDSEDNADITIQKKSIDDKTEKNEEAPVYTTNYKGELISEKDTAKRAAKKSTWKALCDSESSDEEINKESDDPPENSKEYSEEILEPIPYKKKTKSKGGETEKKMTGKEAAKLRKEIESESQRMVREMDVSLPYHKPKQFTLKEFLSRRPKLASSVPSANKLSPSISIKMSKEHLKDILKNLEKRKKEVQEFYKSESEAEDDDDKNDYIPPDAEISENIPHSQNTISDQINDTSISTQDTGIEEIVQDSGIDSQEINEELAGIKTNDLEDEMSSDKFHQQECISENIQNYSTESRETRSSMDYEFNLDGIEENSETIPKLIENTYHTDKLGKTLDTENDVDANQVPEGILEKVADSNNSEANRFSEEFIDHNSLKPAKPFDYTELDKEIENFASTEDVKEEAKPKLSKMDLVRERLANVKPRLSGDENHVIDLDSCIIRPHQVTKLMERFLQHNTRHHHKNRVKVNIVSVESGQIHKETLAMSVDDEDDPTESEATPGAKLQKLRCNLRDQIKQHRSEIWQKKAVLDETRGEDKDPYEGEKSDCGGDDDILDDDEEEEMSESSEEEEEVETKKSQQQQKSAFVDDEAEESDKESAFDEENDIDNKSENDIEMGEEDEDSVPLNEEEQFEESSANKKLKRIVKGFTEDSDDDNDDGDNAVNIRENVLNVIENLNKSITEESTQDDDYIPPYQVQNTKTPIKQITSPTRKSDYDFLTPISYITGLQNLNSASKPKNTVSKSPFRIPNLPSPLKDSNWQSTLQKKLFSGSEITSSQAEAIAEMCSSTFSDSQESTDSHQIVNLLPNSQEDLPCTVAPNTQDLLEICSGDFPATAAPPTVPPSSRDLLDACSGAFSAASGDSPDSRSEPALEAHRLAPEDDTIISQLLDEEEMAAFRRRFDSPLTAATQRGLEGEAVGGGVIDSDDDDDDGLGVRRRRSQMKLTFSDDDTSDDEENKEEEIDLHDDIEEDIDDEPADNIDYDSEENEVEYVDDEDQREEISKPLRAADFFENEAELSESEWGSADEDEKDLDTLEFEQGDTEKFDEKQMRTDLERIHMRRMLDDDTREVKLLQELLLEDGELHGSGRERQFKWKNLDSVDNDEDRKGDEDNESYLDEDESEEQWRRKRFEREMFLKEKQSKSQAAAEDNSDIVEESQFLKIGHKLIGRSQNNSQSSTPVEKPTASPGSPDIKSTFSFMHKRGSFLSRKDQVLQRLAEYNKQTTSIALGTATAKNSRNFLFQTVSVEKTSETEIKKRKTTDDTPRAIKKLRLSDNLSPAVKKKPERLGAKAKLFGNH